MTALIIGVATNKLYANDLDPGDRAQPYLVDVAAELMTADGRTVDLIKRTVRLPKDTSMQAGAMQVNGVTTRTARRSGASQRSIVYMLIEMMNEARYAVSFSDMTRKTVASVIARIAPNDPEWLAAWQRPGIEWCDLRTPATQICKLPYDPPNALGGYRWPARAEAAAEILGPAVCKGFEVEETYANSAAWTNYKIDKSLFLAMRSRGMIEAGEPSRGVAA